jgi:hypothetical protein
MERIIGELIITIVFDMTALYEPLPYLKVKAAGYSTLNFLTTGFLQGWAVNPIPNLNLEDEASIFVTPRDRVTQLYPQALCNHFCHLLQHA